MTDLRTLFALRPDSPHEDVEQFVAHCLTDGGVWDTPRMSDGITLLRVLKREAERLQVCGKIWSIDQDEHSFWLDLAQESSESLRWALHFDVVASSHRKAQHAFVLCDNAEKAQEIQWAVSIGGSAVVRDGVPKTI